jgi:5-methyltetrahydrofolate--homocysteine methyltransferase
MGPDVPAILEALQSGRVLLMDGAMGTELQRAGIGPEECRELWNQTHPERVRVIHQAYADAGADVLLTNTFQANPSHLAHFGLEDRLEELNRCAVRLARKAAGRSRFVLASIGPILDPSGRTEFADPRALGRVLASLDETDGFVLETCSSPRALSAAAYAFHRVPEAQAMPLLLSLTYRRSPSGQPVTISGQTPETYARHAERHGVAALGVNCGRDIGMKEIIEIVGRYRDATDLPLFARPNAGNPRHEGDQWHYPHTPEEMADRLPELLEAGAGMVGGCCGTTPAHIAVFRKVVDAWNGQRGVPPLLPGTV